MSTTTGAALAATAQQQDQKLRVIVKVAVIVLAFLLPPFAYLKHPVLGQSTTSPIQICVAYAVDKKVLEPWQAAIALTPGAAVHNLANTLRCHVLGQQSACKVRNYWKGNTHPRWDVRPRG